MSTELVSLALDRYFSGLQTLDAKSWGDLFAEDAQIYDPVGSPVKSRTDVQQFLGLLSRAIASLSLSCTDQFVVGQQAAAKWTMQVESKAGKSAQAAGITVFEINEQGQIQMLSSYWDEAAFMAQLKG